MSVNLLCIGDLVGKAGRVVLTDHLPGLIEEHEVDFIVCNAENAAGGSGLTPSILAKLRNAGVDGITLGDHCFRKADILPALEKDEGLIRPANLSRHAVGRGWCVLPTKSGSHRVAVISLLGQMDMGNNDSPWSALDDILDKLPDDARLRIVDFHAEATSEKVAMGWHANGRVTAVFGTHTHVPTADAAVLDGGTAFISDLGMTGPYDSILGRRKDRVLKFLTTAMPQRFEMATGDPRMYALLVKADSTTGKATDVQTLCVRGKAAPGGPYDRDDGLPGHKQRNK
jgi:2',3'-cyclic-nucleotide 2'-phosphodiesterase